LYLIADSSDVEMAAELRHQMEEPEDEITPLVTRTVQVPGIGEWSTWQIDLLVDSKHPTLTRNIQH
jgi:hypothetical protein